MPSPMTATRDLTTTELTTHLIRCGVPQKLHELAEALGWSVDMVERTVLAHPTRFRPLYLTSDGIHRWTLCSPDDPPPVQPSQPPAKKAADALALLLRQMGSPQSCTVLAQAWNRSAGDTTAVLRTFPQRFAPVYLDGERRWALTHESNGGGATTGPAR